MKKQIDVVMLPTEKAKNIPVIQYFNDNTQSLDYWNSEVIREYPIEGKTVYEANCIVPQHLSFLSDDEIKDRDWIFNLREGVVEQVKSQKDLKFIKQINSFGGIIIKKIIATTDESLFIEKPTWFSTSESLDNKIIDKIYLPRPSNEFLKKFCELGGIDKVLVEYEIIDSQIWLKNQQNFIDKTEVEIIKLKVAPDNTITIYPI